MTLIVAEKPSVGMVISKALGVSQRHDGYISSDRYIVTWCVGHLVKTAQPEDYNPVYKKWAVADLPIIPNEWLTVAKQNTKKQLGIIKKLMKSKEITNVVCATDAGREGELIFRLVYEFCDCKKPIKRLWISSLEQNSIRQGFANLKSGRDYDNLFQAALCRMRADWLVGMNATRLFTLINGNKELLNIGRVQTPTLALIAKRDNDIYRFVPVPYFNIHADFGSFTAICRVENDTDIICVNQNGYAQVVTSTNKREMPPALYDLTTLQRDANRLLGLSAQQTLDTAQKLYEKKMITYPRTDSRYITNDINIAPILKNVADIFDSRLGYFDWATYSPNKLVGVVSDHHAILPSCNNAKLDGDELNIFSLIAFRLMEAMSLPYVYSQTDVKVDLGGYIFSVSGKKTVSEGFKSITKRLLEHLGKQRKESDDDFSFPENGSIVTVKSIKKERKETQPPKHYTEDTLLEAMEHVRKLIDNAELKDAVKKGIGTPATRAAIIEKLTFSGYVKRDGKKLISTEKAAQLLSLIPDFLKSPELTAEWEYKLELVARGMLTAEFFMFDIADMVNDLVKSYKVSQ
jgi:DNA topoisomerase-3